MKGLRIAWDAWDWDTPTLIIILTIIGFFVFEWLTSSISPIKSWRGNMVTHHLQPVFDASPFIRWIGIGLWLALGPHLFFPGVEDWISKVARQGF